MPIRDAMAVAPRPTARVAAAVTATAVVALGGGLGLAAVAGAEDGAAPATADAIATTSAPPTTSTTTTLPPTTTTAAPALPQPQDAPSDPYEDVPVVAIGRIVIPAIGLDHTVYEGVWLTVIDVGPGHWPGTAMPGGHGNAVFGGHRVTYSHPFRDLDRLAPGDEIIFEMVDGSRHVYAVTEQFVVDPTGVWIVDQMPGHTVTLFACHPKGSARQRIVIRGSLVPPAA